MSIQVRKATKKQCKAKIAIAGGPGCGKTYSSLAVATEAVKAIHGSVLPGKILVNDTEAGSAEKYADEFEFEITTPDRYAMEGAVETIEYAEKNGYEWLIFDSFSHYWMGEGGALERANTGTGNSFNNWKTVTPAWNRLIDKILGAKVNIIADMRLKVQYEIVENDRGKKEPKRLGMEPIMRNDIEYVFDIYGTLDQTNTLTILKTRARKFIPLNSNWHQPGEAFAKAVVSFCGEGVEDRYTMPAEIRTKFDELAASIGEEAFVAKMKQLGFDSLFAITSQEAARAAYKAIADSHKKVA